MRPSLNLSLPTGQKIKIKALGSKQFDKSKSHSNNNSNSNSDNSQTKVQLSSPVPGNPSEESSSFSHTANPQVKGVVATVGSEDEWGDFESAS